MFHFFGPNRDERHFVQRLRRIDAAAVSGTQRDAELTWQNIATLCANYGEYEHKKINSTTVLAELYYVTRNSLLALNTATQIAWPHFESVLSVQPTNTKKIDPDLALGDLWRTTLPTRFDTLDTRWKKRIRALTPDAAAARGVLSVDGACYTGPAGGAHDLNPIAFYDTQLPERVTVIAETVDLRGNALQVMEIEKPDRLARKLAGQVGLADVAFLTDFSHEAYRILATESRNRLQQSRQHVII